MASHLRSIEAKCQVCDHRATVELYDTQNYPLGKYCKRCGERKLKERLSRLGEDRP